MFCLVLRRFQSQKILGSMECPKLLITILDSPFLLVSDWTDSPDGGSRARQSGDSARAHKERIQC